MQETSSIIELPALNQPTAWNKPILFSRVLSKPYLI